ncbi:MAG TPA: response regulator [Bryobacteraceae bacterium]|nr:response regulator [Bryobacteraceae bacterium]
MGATKAAELALARVLLVDDNPTARLTLQTVLEASGYLVDSAASAAEAVSKLDESEYQLVLSDMEMESPQAGLKVLAHARMMNYKPATALVASCQNGIAAENRPDMLIEPEGVPDLLEDVASLIGERTARRLHRELRLMHLD